jgi:hypothetical protein
MQLAASIYSTLLLLLQTAFSPITNSTMRMRRQKAAAAAAELFHPFVFGDKFG